MTVERFEVQREIAAPAQNVFALLCNPNGHVAIDSSGMLQSADGDHVQQAGDEFVVHVDREALNDYPMGKYDVSVIITTLEQDRLIEWTISGEIQPPIKPLRLPTQAEWDWDSGDVVLRLEPDRGALSRQEYLPRHPRSRPARDPRHPREDGGVEPSGAKRACRKVFRRMG